MYVSRDTEAATCKGVTIRCQRLLRYLNAQTFRGDVLHVQPQHCVQPSEASRKRKALAPPCSPAQPPAQRSHTRGDEQQRRPRSLQCGPGFRSSQHATSCADCCVAHTPLFCDRPSAGLEGSICLHPATLLAQVQMPCTATAISPDTTFARAWVSTRTGLLRWWPKASQSMWPSGRSTLELPALA